MLYPDERVAIFRRISAWTLIVVYVIGIPVMLYYVSGVVISRRSTEGPSVALQSGLRISTEPDGALVYLSGAFVGKTPVAATELSPGRHQIRLSLDGFRDWSGTIDLPPGEFADGGSIPLVAQRPVTSTRSGAVLALSVEESNVALAIEQDGRRLSVMTSDLRVVNSRSLTQPYDRFYGTPLGPVGLFVVGAESSTTVVAVDVTVAVDPFTVFRSVSSALDIPPGFVPAHVGLISGTVTGFTRDVVVRISESGVSLESKWSGKLAAWGRIGNVWYGIDDLGTLHRSSPTGVVAVREGFPVSQSGAALQILAVAKDTVLVWDQERRTVTKLSATRGQIASIDGVWSVVEASEGSAIVSTRDGLWRVALTRSEPERIASISGARIIGLTDDRLLLFQVDHDVLALPVSPIGRAAVRIVPTIVHAVPPASEASVVGRAMVLQHNALITSVHLTRPARNGGAAE